MVIGETYKELIKYTQDQVVSFGRITGDLNPIHIDDEYAAKTRFGRTIIHGFLSGSIFSKIIGMNFPGNGAVYLSQSFKFLKPMYVETNYLASVEVVDAIPDKNRFLLRTQILEIGSQTITLEGEALIYYKP